ncbi:MAG: hypothetical protein LLG14_09305 [Nocardiaceae bacterium]|nr:hypothetical protein [Nocardiaceae bacterium]
MVPGLSTYRGMYELSIVPGGGAETLASAMGVSIALAAGVVLGAFLAQSILRGARSRARRSAQLLAQDP